VSSVKRKPIKGGKNRVEKIVGDCLRNDAVWFACGSRRVTANLFLALTVCPLAVEEAPRGASEYTRLNVAF
jgi:hypothetical protein